jgi:hypothetical protein
MEPALSGCHLILKLWCHADCSGLIVQIANGPLSKSGLPGTFGENELRDSAYYLQFVYIHQPPIRALQSV